MTLRSRSIPLLPAALLSLAACNDDTAMSGASADASTTGGISVSATSADPRGVDDGWVLHYVDLTDPDLASNPLDDLAPIPELLWSDFSASGRQFFVSLGEADAQAQNPLGVAMIPLDPLADAVLLSDPDERGFFVHVAPSN